MHRLIPAAAARLGAVVLETPVAHRPRRHGRSKYGTAPLRRGLPALLDCLELRRTTPPAYPRPAHATPAFGTPALTPTAETA